MATRFTTGLSQTLNDTIFRLRRMIAQNQDEIKHVESNYDAGKDSLAAILSAARVEADDARSTFLDVVSEQDQMNAKATEEISHLWHTVAELQFAAASAPLRVQHSMPLLVTGEIPLSLSIIETYLQTDSPDSVKNMYSQGITRTETIPGFIHVSMVLLKQKNHAGGFADLLNHGGKFMDDASLVDKFHDAWYNYGTIPCVIDQSTVSGYPLVTSGDRQGYLSEGALTNNSKMIRVIFAAVALALRFFVPYARPFIAKAIKRARQFVTAIPIVGNGGWNLIQENGVKTLNRWMEAITLAGFVRGFGEILTPEPESTRQYTEQTFDGVESGSTITRTDGEWVRADGTVARPNGNGGNLARHPAAINVIEHEPISGVEGPKIAIDRGLLKDGWMRYYTQGDAWTVRRYEIYENTVVKTTEFDGAGGFLFGRAASGTTDDVQWNYTLNMEPQVCTSGATQWMAPGAVGAITEANPGSFDAIAIAGKLVWAYDYDVAKWKRIANDSGVWELHE
jgi:hypothetical protein